jgi:hypothetical protein
MSSTVTKVLNLKNFSGWKNRSKGKIVIILGKLQGKEVPGFTSMGYRFHSSFVSAKPTASFFNPSPVS